MWRQLVGAVKFLIGGITNACTVEIMGCQGVCVLGLPHIRQNAACIGEGGVALLRLQRPSLANGSAIGRMMGN